MTFSRRQWLSTIATGAVASKSTQADMIDDRESIALGTIDGKTITIRPLRGQPLVRRFPIEPLDRGAVVTNSAWTCGMKGAAFLRRPDDLRRPLTVAVATLTGHILWEQPCPGSTFANASPNLEQVALYGVINKSVSVDLVHRTGARQTLFSAESSLLAKLDPRVTWSPSGERLAFSWNDHIHVYDMAAASARVLQRGKDASWSPDGRYFSFVSDEKLIILDGTREIFRSGRKAVGAPKVVWSSDSKYAVFKELRTSANPFSENHLRADVNLLRFADGALKRVFTASSAKTGDMGWIEDWRTFSRSLPTVSPN